MTKVESVSIEPAETTETTETNVNAEKEHVSMKTSAEETPFTDTTEEPYDADLMELDAIGNILELKEEDYPQFALAKNKARFLRMVGWYKSKEEWIDVAPLSMAKKLFKQQSKELEGVRSNKLDYEMELETSSLTPSQKSYRKDELKMCRVQEKMAVHLIGRLQIKIRSGRR